MGEILQSALDYAERGWPVFPCRPDTKAPLVAHGVKEASLAPETIRDWWKRWPKAMIGVACGGQAGFFVIDIENGKKGGRRFVAAELVQRLRDACGGALPETYTVRTGTGGLHLYYRLPAGEVLKNWVRFMEGADLRTTGGYVIAPPSVRSDGLLYGVAVDRPIAEASPELLAAIPRLLEERKERERAARGRPAATGTVAPAVKAGEAARRYALAALDSETAKLAQTGAGGRNQALNDAAYALGQLVGAGALSRAVVEAALMEAAESCGLRRDDGPAACEATLSSGIAAGMAAPRDLRPIEEKARRRAEWRREPPARPLPPATPGALQWASAEEKAPRTPGGGFFWASHAGEDADAEDEAALIERCALRPLTDLGNAERFKARFGRFFRWCESLGWLAYDGRVWVRDGAEGMLMGAVHKTVRLIQAEAHFVKESGQAQRLVGGEVIGTEEPGALDRIVSVRGSGASEKATYLSDALRQHGRKSEAAGRCAAIRDMAKALPGMAVPATAFDADPMAMAVENGVLKFCCGPAGPYVVLTPHAPEQMISKMGAVIFDPAARAPTWDAFIRRVQPDRETRRFLAAWFGYSLTGDTSAQCFVIFHGTKGANGKSTIETLRAHLLGGYSTSVKIETFLESNVARRGSEANPDLARLPGARHVRTSEPPKGVPFAEELLKQVTGTEAMTVRHLNRDFFEFEPEFKITVQCNREPKASDDPAFWRRVIKVPFDVSIPEEERDGELGAKLAAEGSGVLNVFLAGLVDWMAHGLPKVTRIEAATAAYRERSDVIGTFLKAATVRDEEASVASSRLYEVYKAWCVYAGEPQWRQKSFSNALLNAGFERRKVSSMMWQGLRLVREETAFVTRSFDAGGKPVDHPLDEMGPADVEEAAVAPPAPPAESGAGDPDW